MEGDELTDDFSNRTHQCTGSRSKFIGMDALLEWHDGRFQGHRPHPSDPQPSDQPSFVSNIQTVHINIQRQ